MTTAVHDVRDPLPLPDSSVDAAFAHMLLWMALSTREIYAAVDEIRRVLRPGDDLVHTVRHTEDSYYGGGIAHGDDVYEHGGFTVHFSRRLVDALTEGWSIDDVHAFKEGGPPRRLWRGTRPSPADHDTRHAANSMPRCAESEHS